MTTTKFFLTDPAERASARTWAERLQVKAARLSDPVSTLSGNGLPSSVSLTCSDSILSLCDGATPIPPSSSLLFGGSNGVALGSTYPIKFTLSNNTAAAIPKPTISSELYAQVAFTSTDLANAPVSIAAGSTLTFTIVFTPQATAPGPSSASRKICKPPSVSPFAIASADVTTPVVRTETGSPATSRTRRATCRSTPVTSRQRRQAQQPPRTTFRSRPSERQRKLSGKAA